MLRASLSYEPYMVTLPKKVAHVRIVHDQRSQSVPQVVERVKPFRVAARALVMRLYERPSQFDRVGQVFLAEFVRETKIVFRRHAFRMRRMRNDEAVSADDLLLFRIPDDQLPVSFRIEVVFVDVRVGSRAASAVAERHFPEPSDFPHYVRAVAGCDDVYFIVSVIGRAQKAFPGQFCFYQIGRDGVDQWFHRVF